MGKSNRGKSEEAMRQYGDPAYQASTGLAKQAGNVYYGGPSGGSQQGRTAKPRDRKPSAGVQPTGEGKKVDYDRVYEVYRWWKRKGETGGNSDPNRTREHPWKMGENEWALLDQIIGQGDTYQPAFDYREAQKRGASTEELAKFSPDKFGFSGYQGSPVTQSEMEGGGAGGVAGQAITDYGEMLDRYRKFADTGGYSPEDIGAIRSRALSPVRAAYSDINRDIDRSRSLQGDYAPGYAATKAKVGREQAYTTADATTNVEAALAQMKQQGKLAGMGGMASLYGTTPGQASMFGKQALQSQALQNQMGLGMMSARNQSLQQPGMFDTITSGLGKVGGMIYPWL